MKQQLPGAEVHYLTKSSFADVVKANPNIDKIWLAEKNNDALITQLKAEKFDFIADLHHNIRSFRFRNALGVKSAAFNKLNIEKWLMVNFKFNRLPEEHIVNRYMQTVKSLGVIYDGKGLDYFINLDDEISLETLPAPWRNGYVGFVIGAKHYTKRLPAEKIIEIINLMKLPVILLGGKEDIDAANEIIAETNGFSFSACGNYRLAQSASLVRQSKFIITHDTGLMHIAAAFNKKIISVWGNTIPEFGMAPFLAGGKGASVIMENKLLNCRPCSKIGYEKCPRGHFLCMQDINSQSLVNQGIAFWNDHYQETGT